MRAAMLLAAAVVLAPVLAPVLAAQPDSPPPRADHHAHLVSPTAREIIRQAGFEVEELTASDLVRLLDSTGIHRAAVLSMAYALGRPDWDAAVGRDEYEQVRAENDWLRRELAPYGGRLFGFCGVNPLRSYAVQEIRRCARLGLRGLKLHFANSAVDLNDSDHLERLRVVFAAANAARLPIVAHIRTRSAGYGAPGVRALIERVLPAARDVPVQIAHMAGWGGYDAATDSALAAFVQAFGSGAHPLSNVFFDLSGVVVPPDALDAPRGHPLRLLVDQAIGYPDGPGRLRVRIREVGVDRVVFGTDLPFLSPPSYAALLRERLGLEAAEVETILTNVAPYLEGSTVPGRKRCSRRAPCSR